MTKNLYLNIFLSFIILLIGFYYSTTTFDFWISRIIAIISIIISCFSLLGFKYKNVPNKKNNSIKVIQLFAVLIGFSGMFLVIYFSQNLIFKFAGWELEKAIKPEKNNIVRFLAMLVVWSFLEEIYYRRILAQKLFNMKGFSKALWISSLIFSIGHLFSDTGLFYALIGGLLLAYLYLKTQSIWLSIIAHLYYNLLTFYFSLKIPDFNANMKIVGLVGIGLLLISIMVFLINKSTKIEIEIQKPVGNNV